MEIKILEIAGFGSAFKALRLPFGKECRSIHKRSFDGYDLDDMDNNDFAWMIKSLSDIAIHKKDLTLLQTLIKRGDEHAKVVRGIIAYAEITAPVYFFAELETYRAGHERLCSESTMHIDCRGLKGEDLQKAKAEIPMGKELTKIDMFSYQCLRNIVKQRQTHRLPEWHTFIDWVRTLPLADELIFIGLNKEE